MHGKARSRTSVRVCTSQVGIPSNGRYHHSPLIMIQCYLTLFSQLCKTLPHLHPSRSSSFFTTLQTSVVSSKNLIFLGHLFLFEELEKLPLKSPDLPLPHSLLLFFSSPQLTPSSLFPTRTSPTSLLFLNGVKT